MMKSVKKARTTIAPVLMILHMRYKVISSRFKVQGSKFKVQSSSFSLFVFDGDNLKVGLSTLNFELETLNCVEDALSRAYRVAVNLDRVVDVFGVAARHDGRDREAASAALAQD